MFTTELVKITTKIEDYARKCVDHAVDSSRPRNPWVRKKEGHFQWASFTVNLLFMIHGLIWFLFTTPIFEHLPAYLTEKNSIFRNVKYVACNLNFEGFLSFKTE